MRWGRWALPVALAAFAAWRGNAQVGVLAAGQDTATRVIDDKATGSHWVLRRNPDHPGGPGRMVQIGDRAAEPGKLSVLGAKAVPVIHAGDRVVVEDTTAVVSARLDGIALGSAPPGGVLMARLTVGGRAVRVIAVAPGRAQLIEEARP